jgi:trans-AT polyketide synthase, acyltransferase and oxidoreductase domains
MLSTPNTKTPVNSASNGMGFLWSGDVTKVFSDQQKVRECILNFEKPVFVVEIDGKIGYSIDGKLEISNDNRGNTVALSMPITTASLGDSDFCKTYHVSAAYYAGGMANAIASEDLVIALGKSKLMGCFGSGGLSLDRITTAIDTIQSELNNAPYMFNLLHNPFEPNIEQRTVELFLEKRVPVIEAAAYINLTHALVQYRVTGLSQDDSGNIQIKNHIIAKISRKEVAQRFLQPPPEKILQTLISDGKITQTQANIARQVPMADDITVEADSGGHTDNQPLVSLLPSIIALRDQSQVRYQFKHPVRIGAAGGISTPRAVLGAYMMGAAYVVTGSINQACIESGASNHTKNLLAQAEMADVTMAPSADMFEMGSRVQVLKKGSLFPMRAQKLYDLYTTYASLEEIPADIRQNLENKIFNRKIDDIWNDTVIFFNQRDPDQITKAEKNPKKKMALVFRWYLGLASRWSRDGVEDRRMDYQIWCGPSMGAFNEWAKGTYLEEPSNRVVADIAWQLIKGCSYLSRIQVLKLQGVSVQSELERFYPRQ